MQRCSSHLPLLININIVHIVHINLYMTGKPFQAFANNICTTSQLENGNAAVTATCACIFIFKKKKKPS